MRRIERPPVNRRSTAGRAPRPARPDASATWTVERLIEHGARRFRAHGLVFGHGTLNARDEAAYLTLHALRLPLEPTPGIGERCVSQREVAQVLCLFERRILERKPAAYLTREAWLGDFNFYVDERAIVPRSYIAELLRERLAPWVGEPADVRTALDLCAGSGCLAILLAKAFTRARVDAAEISAAALAVADINVRRYRLRRRVHLVASDLFAALHGRRYDVIVSNPPYVRAAVMHRLPQEYRAEPPQALAGGKDGLDCVRAILRSASTHLNPGGWLVVETGHNRRAVERAWPHLDFTWPITSSGDDCVFVISREGLLQQRLQADRARAARRARRPRRASTSARA